MKKEKKSENVNARSTEQGEVELDLIYLNPLHFLCITLSSSGMQLSRIFLKSKIVKTIVFPRRQFTKYYTSLNCEIYMCVCIYLYLIYLIYIYFLNIFYDDR